MQPTHHGRLAAIALTLAALGGFTPGALAAGLTVSPTTIANNYNGKITLAITGLTTGQAVVVERYADLNANAAIDAGEPLIQAGMVTDGAVSTIGGVRNLNVPGDEDGAANGQIRVEAFYPSAESGLDVIACKQVIRISDPASGFTPVTQPFEVTQNSLLAQGVSGQLTAAGSGAPLARVMVVLLPFDSSPVTGTVTDASGNYTLRSVPGDYTVLALAPGFVSDFTGSATVTAGAFAPLNLALPAATRTISGKLKDSASATGLPGIFVMSEPNSGQFAAAFTNSTGDYSLGVLAGSWPVSPSSSSLARLGYVGLGNAAVADATSGNVSNFDLSVNPATALIYGTLKTNLDVPMVGIDMWSDDQSGQLETSARTYPTTADYCVGVRPGDWWVGPDSTALSALGYLSQGTNVTVVAGQAVHTDFVATPANAHLMGRVVDDLGAPMDFINLNASDHQGIDSSVTTDADGYFDIRVGGGTWYLMLNSDEAGQRQLVGPQMQFTLTANQTIDNIDFVVLHTTRTISGYVRDSASQPVNAWVYASANIGGTTYFAEAGTTGGNYVLQVANGTWQVGANANGFINPDQQPAVFSGSNATVNFVVQSTPPLGITTTQLPDGMVGAGYSAQLSATGGQQPYNWHLPGGTASLPPGVSGDMSFFSDGSISGTPGTAGTYNFEVGVHDNASPQQSTLAMVSITILPAGGGNAAPGIISHPSNQSVAAGQTAVFTVAATGSPTPGYQWQLSTDNGSNWSILVNGGAYSGVSLATLTVTPGSGFNNYRYRCVAGNSEGSATSNSATLTVSVPNVAPNITTQPSNQTVSAGQSASFIVAATGAPTPGYQWQVSTDGGSNWGILVNGGAYSGVTRPTLAVATNSGLNGYLYRVVVTNSSGAATSNAASLTVTGPAAGAPAINLQPSAQMLTVGQNVNFTVAATGSPTPGYQWQLSTDSGSNWSILVGAGAYSGVNLATLTVVPSAGFNGYQYRCVVSNSAGSVTSNAAALTEAALSAIETWRQQYFGSPSNSGNGADNATSDHDGVPNLVKYGLVITPGSPGVSSLPAAQTLTYAEGKRLALIFSRAPARNDVTLVVQGSDNLAGPWTTLATSANGAAFTGPGFVSETNADGGLKSVEIRDTVNMSAAPHRFMRIEVTH